MKQTPSSNPRILSIGFSSRGFGFAVLEGQQLVDWGTKAMEKALAKAEQLILRHQPDTLVLQEFTAEDFRRSAKAKKLNSEIASLAVRYKLKVKPFTKRQVTRVFFANGEGTKYELALLVAERFPEELAPRLPPKRKPWMSEDGRMSIFMATALALTFLRRKRGAVF